MKSITNASLFAVVLLIATSLQAEDSPAVKQDIAQLQGEWLMVSGSADGTQIPDSLLPDSKRVCIGDEVTAMVGGQLVMKAKITIDPTKQPKTIDYQVTEGPTKGFKHLGIYELDGDTFKSCFAAPEGERPTAFNTQLGDRRTLSVWKRKPAAAPSGQK